MLPRPTLEAFDAWLASRSLQLEAIVVGGSALALLGVTERQTRDVDILHPELSAEVALAAREFAAHLRGQDVELADDWLNNGPMQLAEVLPDGWRLRIRSTFEGAALRLTVLGRTDLLKTKLFALCDRGTDLADCIALSPDPEELDEAEPWLVEQDANPMWPEHVRSTLANLRRRLGHGL
jgi:hypothetical protein